ncbi:MAG TPA: methylated-DNA--[protein]-cysteine S-methyltransferase [Verrucomicrobiae bacterium]|nr:methylated-DNA--[protein]-cysteine S-methyltransferase [Verrucomicrobiae bacterium]
MTTFYKYLDTPAGTMLLTSDGTAITGMHWKVFKRAPTALPDWIQDDTPFAVLLQQLQEYFAGKRQVFDVPIKAHGTSFQLAVWGEIAKIPFGETSTYGQLAARIGRPSAMRAVGTAVGSNPHSIVVPCHRILATGGRITGYAGGLESKATLLALEGVPIRY